MRTVAIFGVGLIGGSFALALRKAGFPGRILGVSSTQALDKALESGTVDAGATLEQASQEADLLYLAQPIHRILETLPQLNQHVRAGALITDAGSTKSSITQLASRSITACQFLGGHPLAGKETRGVESASPDLFQGRTYVLTPGSPAELETSTAREFLTWLERIGAVPMVMNPQDHDRTVAYTSHLPQLASTALAVLLGSRGEDVQSVFGPALVDSTRLALSPFAIWKDILETNHSEVERALDEYIHTLQRLRQHLKRPDLEVDFEEGAKFAGHVRRSDK